MKIKITHPIDGKLAGLVYDVPEKKAQEYIENGVAIVVIEEKEPKKVKHGDG